MRALLIIGAMGCFAWFVYAGSSDPGRAANPAVERLLKEAEKQAHTDYVGEKGKEARRICNRVLGITSDPTTARDVIRSGYSSETAHRWMDCVVNYMYPTPAEKPHRDVR